MNRGYPYVMVPSINLIGFSYSKKEHLDIEVDSDIWNEFMFYLQHTYFDGHPLDLYIKCYNEIFFVERIEKSKWGGIRATVKCIPVITIDIKKPSILLEMKISKDLKEEGHLQLCYSPRKRHYLPKKRGK